MVLFFVAFFGLMVHILDRLSFTLMGRTIKNAFHISQAVVKKWLLYRLNMVSGNN